MIHYLQRFNRATYVALLIGIIAIAMVINLNLKMFLGGFYLIAAVIGGLLMNRKEFIALIVLLSMNFMVFAYQFKLPMQAVYLQGAVYYICLMLAVWVSYEIKGYIRMADCQKAENEHLFNEIIHAFIEAIDAKDHYLHNHSYRVCLYSLEIAKNMGFDDLAIKRVGLAALFHDIGKLSISEYILNKPEPLSTCEWTEMKKHVCKGIEILHSVTKLEPIIPIIKYHHRHFDGSGYPNDLDNDKIPLESRILAVADAFDAMTSDRPYRLALSIDQALKELIKCKGSQFDPRVVDAFFKADIQVITSKLSRDDLPNLL